MKRTDGLFINKNENNSNYTITLSNFKFVGAPTTPSVDFERSIKNVYFNSTKGTTVVKWNDGTTTKVKCDGEAFDKEKGLAMCILKKLSGNTGKYFEVFKKFAPEDVEEQNVTSETNEVSQ